MGTVSFSLGGASDLDVGALMLLTKWIQISQRMSHGVIVAGTEHFKESHWHDDTLKGLPYDDVLWGYMVRICEDTGGEGAFTQWVWVELIESSETICPANTHQAHAEFI